MQEKLAAARRLSRALAAAWITVVRTGRPADPMAAAFADLARETRS